MTSLKDIPQFAYLPGRGLSDALDRPPEGCPHLAPERLS